MPSRAPLRRVVLLGSSDWTPAAWPGGDFPAPKTTGPIFRLGLPTLPAALRSWPSTPCDQALEALRAQNGGVTPNGQVRCSDYVLLECQGAIGCFRRGWFTVSDQDWAGGWRGREVSAEEQQAYAQWSQARGRTGWAPAYYAGTFDGEGNDPTFPYGYRVGGGVATAIVERATGRPAPGSGSTVPVPTGTGGGAVQVGTSMGAGTPAPATSTQPPAASSPPALPTGTGSPAAQSGAGAPASTSRSSGLALAIAVGGLLLLTRGS